MNENTYIYSVYEKIFVIDINTMEVQETFQISNGGHKIIKHQDGIIGVFDKRNINI